jgi:hypothetical protein
LRPPSRGCRLNARQISVKVIVETPLAGEELLHECALLDAQESRNSECGLGLVRQRLEYNGPLFLDLLSGTGTGLAMKSSPLKFRRTMLARSVEQRSRRRRNPSVRTKKRKKRGEASEVTL